MTITVLQRPATKDSPCLLVVYAATAVGPALREAMPPGSGIAVTSETRPGLTRAAIARAFGITSIRRLVAAGYSAGCHGLRDMLPSLALTDDDVVVPCDGTHVRPLPDTSMPEGPWRTLLDDARASRGPLVVVTHSYLTYTDSLRDDPRTAAVERPYLSTASTLRRLTGWPLEEPPIGERRTRLEGRLRVVSYESGEADAAAHGRQLREALPTALREHVAPWLAGAPRPDLVSMVLGPIAGALWRLAGSDKLPIGAVSSVAERSLVVARAELEAAPRELPGAAHDPRIVAYGDPCRRGGAFVGVDAAGAPVWTGGPKLVAARTDEEAWCAKLASWCYLHALRPGETPVHGLRVAVAELVADARASGRWRDVSAGYSPKPGDLAIWRRAGGDPRKGGSGHVARVETAGGDGFVTIGGNEANTILRTPRRYSDPELVGFVEV